jgi:hypothetical protein
MPTLSSFPPIRANAVVVVVVVVVDITVRRDAKEKYNTQPIYFYCISFVLHAIAIYFTSRTILLQYSPELSVSKCKFIDNSIYVII